MWQQKAEPLVELWTLVADALKTEALFKIGKYKLRLAGTDEIHRMDISSQNQDIS